MSLVTPIIHPRVLNKKGGGVPRDAVYIGRPSIWGNPFQIGRDGDRRAVIAKHRAWLKSQSVLLASIGELAGRDLVCFCAPLACHGHALLWLANPQLRDLALWPESLRPALAGLEDLVAAANAHAPL